MRENLNRQRLEKFLQEFGKVVRWPVRLLITGGAMMIWKGLRGETVDVDVSYQVDSQGESAVSSAILDLKERLNINIELAEPAHFIPVPKDRENRFSSVGKFGAVEVFLDDPYTIALSKLHRGHEKDLEDVKLLAQAGWLDYSVLEAKLREIASPETSGCLRIDLNRLLARLAWIQKK